MEGELKAPAFSYARAGSVEEATALLAGDPEGARVLAGGQSLIASLNMRLSAPSLLVDINRVEELGRIDLDGDRLRIGATARQARIAGDPLVGQHAPLIARAVTFIAHPAIRNRGTIGGSIAFADPAAELPACLLALGAEIEIAGAGGARRRVAADSFFKGLYETALGESDLVTAVLVPVARPGQRFGFDEIARRHGDYALAGLAATDDGAGPRLAFFGVADTPVRARGAEAALGAGDLDGAVAALGSDFVPLEDDQTSGAARVHLAGVLLRRVAGAIGRAGR